MDMHIWTVTIQGERPQEVAFFGSREEARIQLEAWMNKEPFVTEATAKEYHERTKPKD